MSKRDDHDGELDDVTPEERARAQSFGRLVDGLMDDKAAPPALEAEERALLETAGAVRAALGTATLSDARARALVDDVLAPASGKPAPVAGRRAPTAPVAPVRRGHRLRGALPWALSAMCAAAALALLLRGVAPVRHRAMAPLRSTDALVGPIPLAEAGDASSRIDLIYGDRLAAARRGGSR